MCSTLPAAAAGCPTSLAKLGYQVTGVDVCEDLLAMARQRIREDRHLRVEPQFVVADIEAEPIKYGEFEAAIFESCFEHFQNPIAALRHVAASLAPEGVVVLTESECRQGPLKEEWVASMHQYQTIEPPYARAQFVQILEFAGLLCYESFAPVDGWYSPRSAEAHSLSATASAKAALQNRCVAARTAHALRRVIPSWEPPTDVNFSQGFSAGTGAKYWCGPQGLIKINRDIPEMFFLMGGEPTQHQTVALYHGGRRVECRIRGHWRMKQIRLISLRAGDEIHLCSDFAFSPAWTGKSDTRLLSFWIERLS